MTIESPNPGDFKEYDVSQNLVSLTLTDEQLAAADQALATLEEAFAGLIGLDVAARKGLSRMGPKSEQFCRQTLEVLAQNRQVVPPSVALDEGLLDLDTLDRLRPRLHRLRKLMDRADDTDTALGSDVMSLALEGYALLKLAGRNQGLESLRRELGGRFSKTPATRGAPLPA